MKESSPCSFLEWDSHFFARRIGRVEGHRLDAELRSRISEWCREQAIDCLYFLADSNDSQTVVCAEEWKAHFVDIRVTMEFDDMPRTTSGTNVRACRDEDLPSLRRIARTSHLDGRFFFDPGFQKEQCESFYETWITRSYEGFADAVLVAELDGKPAGYVTCHLERPSLKGRIGLFAVGEEARGFGVGQSLTGGALHWFAGKQVEHVEVVTQGRNVAAQRLYAKCGFQIRSLSIWYHKWFNHG